MADSSSFTNATGQPAPPGTLAYQQVQGWQNSLNQYERSIQNLLGKSGQEILGKGGSLLDSGTATLGPSIDYWKGILSGNKADIASAAEPELTATSNQFQSQRRVLDQYTPMGGGRSQSLAASRSAEAQTKAGIISKTRAAAAPELAQAGIAEQGVGLGEQQLGLDQLSKVLTSLIQRAGIDIQGGTAATFSQILQGIGAII